MPTKGPSFRYGKTNGSRKSGSSDYRIGYAWAKDFNKGGIKRHYLNHSKEFDVNSIEEYIAKAVHFANNVDKKNYRSVVDFKDTTYKYDIRTGEMVEVSKDGYIISYRHIGNKFWYYPRKGVRKWIKI